METRTRVAALIVTDGRILLVAATSNRAYLVPPGGGVEPGESLAAAVVRETAEEAGLAVEAGRLVAYREVQRPARHELELYFTACPVQAPTFADSTSAEDRAVRWVPLETLCEVPHFPEQLVALCDLLRNPEAGAVCLQSSSH